MLRRLATVFACIASAVAPSALRAEAAALEIFQRVEVAPTKTSIYVGSVSMTMPVFTRTAGVYHTTYAAKVFPYFFSNENGRLSVDIGDELLRKLERGEPIEFKGRAVNEAGEERRVEGKAVPLSPTEGKIKVRVFVSKRIELIFNTTYRFLPAAVSTAISAGRAP
jgi:hypothetical protein